jgi:2-iminobutanoate/2-iminopropanoate deaminase
MLSGHDDESPAHELPPQPERELEILFRHIRGFVEAAGGTVNDLINVTFFVMEDAYRDLVVKEWAKIFPEARRQPPYHILNVAPSGLRGERVEAVVVARVPR